MPDSTSPFFPAWDRFQRNGDEIMAALGTKAGSYWVNGTQVIGARLTGWTASTGGTSGQARTGVNGTFALGTFDTTTTTTTGTFGLALGTQVVALTKLVAALQADITSHGLIGT